LDTKNLLIPMRDYTKKEIICSYNGLNEAIIFYRRCFIEKSRNWEVLPSHLLKLTNQFIVLMIYADCSTNPDPLTAVIIITVKSIKTTIAPITIKIGNQSVTPAIPVVVSPITSVAPFDAS